MGQRPDWRECYGLSSACLCAHVVPVARRVLKLVRTTWDVKPPAQDISHHGDTFRVLKDRETKHLGEYRKRRLVLDLSAVAQAEA